MDYVKKIVAFTMGRLIIRKGTFGAFGMPVEMSLDYVGRSTVIKATYELPGGTRYPMIHSAWDDIFYATEASEEAVLSHIESMVESENDDIVELGNVIKDLANNIPGQSVAANLDEVDPLVMPALNEDDTAGFTPEDKVEPEVNEETPAVGIGSACDDAE